jgi:NAD(P)-dependent dehydrogenase (short-subunit alcohol dehydrogenase family)|eukprot:COSAG06_NODE_7113_length_2627_cov_1.848497_2_plen_136_part_00
MSENHTAEAGTITPELVTSKSSANGRKSIFVTGGARGIGRATCELFAAQGWFIGCFDLNAESLLETVKVLGRDNCIAQVLDVTDVAAVQTAVSRFGERTKCDHRPSSTESRETAPVTDPCLPVSLPARSILALRS